MTIRRLDENDVPTVVDMGMRFLESADYREFIKGDPCRLEALIRATTITPGMSSWVAEQDGRLVGMLGMLTFYHPMSGEHVASEIAWWVEPEARGAGIKMLRVAEAWAKEQGATRLLMIAPNEHVETFYKRTGFARVEASYQRSL